MDAFELGWRARPSEDLLIELSLYHYDTKDAIFSGPPQYEPNGVRQLGEKSHLIIGLPSGGGYSFSRGEKDGERQTDFSGIHGQSVLTSQSQRQFNL